MQRTSKRAGEGTRRTLSSGAGGHWLALGWLLLVSCMALAGETISKEYQLKAAFLYNFTKFVEWDAQSYRSPNSPIVIGVLGSSPLSDELEEAVRNRMVNGRAITVRRVVNGSDATGVHLLFVNSREDGRFADLRAVLQSANVLTVGESDAFSRLGGIITFVIESDRVRFDINMAAADQASLRISAQLQKLARSVRR